MHRPVLWQLCSGPQTWFGRWLWLSRLNSHRLSKRTVWTEHPLILTCQCQHTGSWLCKWDGSRGAGRIEFFWWPCVGTWGGLLWRILTWRHAHSCLHIPIWWSGLIIFLLSSPWWYRSLPIGILASGTHLLCGCTWFQNHLQQEKRLGWMCGGARGRVCDLLVNSHFWPSFWSGGRWLVSWPVWVP